VKQETGISMVKHFQSMQEVLTDTQDPALKQQVALSIKSRLLKYRNKDLWNKIVNE